MTYQKKQVLVVAKTYPNLSRKYDRTVCTAGIDLQAKSWIRIFPIRFFDLEYAKRFSKWDVIELEVEPTKDKYLRKESHHAHDSSIQKLRHIDTKNNWEERKSIIIPMQKKSVEDLKNQYKLDHTSMGVIKPKLIVDFKVTPIDKCRPWEKALIMGIQQTLDGEHYQSPLEKIPYKFSYVFKCDDSDCTKNHDLMIEDWEICELYRKTKQDTKDEQYALAQVSEKYKDRFLTKNELYFVLGTESRWNKWLIISVFYPMKQPQTCLSLN